MRKILLFIFLFISLYAKEIYIMPYESKKALNALLKSIDLAKNKIDIAIYSFTNKIIAKRLKNAAKRGVKIRIVFDEEANLYYKKSQLRYLSKYQNIQTFTISGKPFKKYKSFGKMHMKIAVIDNKRVIFGSANYSFSAFSKNYEILFIDDDYALAKKIEKYYEMILREAKRY